jgi:hypothetical protein
MEYARRSSAHGDTHGQTCTRIGMDSSRRNARSLRTSREGSHALPEVKSTMTSARTPIWVKRPDAECALLIELRRTRGCGVGGKCRCRRRYGVCPDDRRAIRRRVMVGRQSIPRQCRPRTQHANHARRPGPAEQRVAPSTRLPSRDVGLLVTAEISNSDRQANGQPLRNFVLNRPVRRQDGYIQPGRPQARGTRAEPAARMPRSPTAKADGCDLISFRPRL